MSDKLQFVEIGRKTTNLSLSDFQIPGPVRGCESFDRAVPRRYPYLTVKRFQRSVSPSPLLVADAIEPLVDATFIETFDLR
jgi:hypothetical protein